MLLHLNSAEGRAIAVLLMYLVVKVCSGGWRSSAPNPLMLVLELCVVCCVCRWFARGEPLKLRPVDCNDIAWRCAETCPEVVAVVTGGSSGVGLEVAKALAQRGMSVIITGRDEKRLETAAAHILAVLDAAESASLQDKRRVGCRIETAVVDMTNRSHIVQFSARIRQRNVALLVNNAGELCRHHAITDDTQERMMAANTFGPMLLTELVLPSLRRTSSLRGIPSRVVNVASCAHTVCWGDALRQAQEIHGRKRDYTWLNFVYFYGLSKLSMIWFSLVLWKRLATECGDGGDRVVVACCHPGIISTRLYRNLLPEWALLLAYVPSLLVGKTCAEGASAVLRACIDDVVLNKRRSMVYMLCGGDRGVGSANNLLSALASDELLAHRFCVDAYRQIGVGK